MADLIQAEVPVQLWPALWFVVDDNIRRADVLLGMPLSPGSGVAAAYTRGPQGMIATMKDSNLRGRGGAGFVTGLKWDLCQKTPGLTRYVVCNADEGEPGTFKDRVLLSRHADIGARADMDSNIEMKICVSQYGRAQQVLGAPVFQYRFQFIQQIPVFTPQVKKSVACADGQRGNGHPLKYQVCMAT